MIEVIKIKQEPNDLFFPDTSNDEYYIINDITVAEEERRDSTTLYKFQPVEGLNHVKTTEDLYNRQFFKLQMNEILSETPIMKKRHELVQTWKKFFGIFVKTLPDDTILLSYITAAKNLRIRVDPLTRSLSENITDLKTDVDLMLKFRKPLWHEMFGLYENKCQPGPEVTLYVHIIMPEICFHKHDYLNNRYIIKKYYYLLYLEKYLKQSEMCDTITTIKLTYHDNNFLLPILKLHLEHDDNVTINIFVTAGKRTFDPSRFLPDKINVDINIFSSKVSINVLKSIPTVYYNSSLGFDETLSVNICYLSKTLHGLTNLHNGIKLLSIWLKQRELNLIGFTEDLVVYFVVYLYEKKIINNYMSSYEIIKNFWNFISTSDLKNKPISLRTVSEHFMQKFKNYYDVIFLDITGYYNLTSFLIKDVYDKVKSESDLALKLLKDDVRNSYHQLFLNRYRFYLQYDLTIKISKPTWNLRIRSKDRALFSGCYYFLMVQNLLNTLKFALDKRYLHIIPKIETEGNKITKLFIGINLNPDEAFNNLILGPAIDDAGRKFRLFWRAFAGFKRLDDGSFHTAVEFQTDTVRSKRQIIMNILKFVLGQKLNLKYEIFYDEFENYLVNKILIPRLIPPSRRGTNEETTLEVINAWDTLGKLLRELSVFLNITEIQAISDIFCYTDAFPPIPQNFEKIDYSRFLAGEADEVPLHIQPIYSVFKSEDSSIWSDYLKIIRNMKPSFYLRIAAFLESKHNITARVSTDYIEIPFHGLVFRYILFIQREIDLVKQVSHETPLTNTGRSIDSFEMEKRYVFLPKIIEGLKGVQAQYSSFGPGTALIKRWLRAQLIDDFYFPDIAVDLVNASLYLNSSSNNVKTPQASFLRFLNYFSDFDGRRQLLVVNFNNIFSKSDMNKHKSKLVRHRETYPSLFILTPFDETLSVFTQENPSQNMLSRITKLCRLSLDLIEGATSGKSTFNRQRIGHELFIPKYNGYNVLIHLKNSLNSRRYQKIVPLEEDGRVVVEKLNDVNTVLPPVVDVNPVDEYLKTLRKNYGNKALFFHDSYGGNIIGVLWYPKVFLADDFKVPQLKRMKLSECKLDFNTDAAIDDFEVLAKGLVESIQIVT